MDDVNSRIGKRGAAGSPAAAGLGRSGDRGSLDLGRLLRSAAQTRGDVLVEAPFGFDARVVALWRASENKPNGLAALVRRVAVLSLAVIAISSAAAFGELRQSREIVDSVSDEFAIADSAIQNEFGR